MNTNSNMILAAAIVKFLDAQVAENPRNMSEDAIEGLKGTKQHTLLQLTHSRCLLHPNVL